MEKAPPHALAHSNLQRNSGQILVSTRKTVKNIVSSFLLKCEKIHSLIFLKSAISATLYFGGEGYSIALNCLGIKI